MVELTLEGEGMSFNREISESIALKVMNLVISNGSNKSAAETLKDTADDTFEEAGLPNNFFDRLTDRQEAYIRVLLEDGDWVSNEEVRERLEAAHGLPSGGPQGIAGIRAGFTRKWGDNLNLDERHWMGDQNEYRLNPDRIEKLKEGLN